MSPSHWGSLTKVGLACLGEAARGAGPAAGAVATSNATSRGREPSERQHRGRRGRQGEEPPGAKRQAVFGDPLRNSLGTSFEMSKFICSSKASRDFGHHYLGAKRRHSPVWLAQAVRPGLIETPVLFLLQEQGRGLVGAGEGREGRAHWKRAACFQTRLDGSAADGRQAERTDRWLKK